MNKRDQYRIPYPLPERPTLELEDREYEVIDCSASGLRFALPLRRTFSVGTTLQGRVRFRRGDVVEITGRVVRVTEHEAAVHFVDTEIPFGVLLNEQRYLRAHYPMWP